MRNGRLIRFGAASVAAALVLAAGAAEAQTYIFNIVTSQDTASGQFTIGNPALPNQVTAVTGSVDGTAITALSTYGGADQYLSAASPYVDRAGVGFTNGTLNFNIFANYITLAGTPVYSFCNSAFNGGCTGGDANAAPVATFT